MSGDAGAPLHRVVVPLDGPLDLALTLGPLHRGPADPTMRLSRQRAVRATRTAAGPACIALEIAGDRLVASAWGPGAEEALEAVPALVGLSDDAAAFRPEHPLLRELARRRPGLRLGRTGAVMEALVPAILEQKVTGTEAFRAFRGLVRSHGEPAPGPFGLWLPPTADRLAGLPYHAFHPFGVEQRRADTIRHVAARGPRLERLASAPVDLEAAYAGLRSFRGVGPWTAAEVGLRAFGDADAVSVGDFHLPHLVAFALAGEARADDARMLELLEPYRGQRARVIRLLETSGIAAPRYGPRMPVRSIASI